MLQRLATAFALFPETAASAVIFRAKGDMMKGHPFFLIGWILTATVLLSLAGLPAAPFHERASGQAELTAAS
jgi:uncharacterized membrane protein YecN with MAPEG domain